MVKYFLKKNYVIGIIILILGASLLPSVTSTKIRESLTITESRKILYVDDDFNETTPGWNVTHFDKIQNALDNASDGDTIEVNEGIYNESNLMVDISVEIIGNSSENTIIDGNNATIFYITSDGVKITGFELRNCDEEFTYPYSGAIYVEQAEDINISYNLFSNNCFDINFLFCWGKNRNIIVSHNDFMNGKGNHSGGIWIFNCIQIAIIHNTFREKKSHGVGMMGSEYNLVQDNILEGEKTQSSYGIGLGSSYMNFIEGNIINSYYYGLNLDNTRENVIRCNDISENEIGVYMTHSRYDDISYNNIDGNTHKELIAYYSYGWFPWNWWGTSSGSTLGRVKARRSVIICQPMRTEGPYSVPIKNIDIFSFP